jgi:uncharacterized protein involved in outer membrane biogenesis
MKRTGIVLAIIAVVIIVALFAVPPLLDVNRYHGLVQAQLQKALGRPVTFGAMRLSLTPPSLRLDNLMVGEDPAFGSGAFASAESVTAAVRLWPLLRGNVQVESLKLEEPKLQIVRSAQGKWNVASLGQAAAKLPPVSAPAGKQPPAPAAAPGGIALSDLNITAGQVTLVDQKTRSRGVYDNIDLSLHGYAPGRAFNLDAKLHVPGPGTEIIELSGRAGPLAPAGLAASPFDGKLELKEVSLTGVQRVLDSQALAGIEGIATGSFKLRNQEGVLASEGSLKLEQGRIRGVVVGYPITLDYKFTDQLAQDLIRVEQGALRLGATPLSVTGTINAGATPATVDLKVSTRDASLAEAAHLASAFGVAFNPGTKVSGRMNADVSAQGPTSHPALNGTLSAGKLEISGGDLKQAVRVDNIALALSPREVRATPFTATTGSTRLAVQFALADYTSAAPRVQATLRTVNASLGELLAIADAYGVGATAGMSGSGAVNLDISVSGPLKNLSALNFNGSGKLQEASLHMPSLAQPLKVGHADIQFSQNSATLRNLAFSLGSIHGNGNVTVRDFASPYLQFTLSGDKLDLGELQRLLAAPAPQPRAQMGSLVPAAWAQAPAGAQPGFLSRATGKGNVTLGALQYDQLLLNHVRSGVTLERGVIRMAPMSADAYGGQATGSVVLDTRATPTAITVTTKMDKVDANQLLSSVSSVKKTLYGLLAGNATTDFRVTDSGNIASTLNGNVALDLTKGRLVGMDLLQQLANIGRFLGALNRAPQSFTEIVRLTGTFDVVNGLAQTRNLTAIIPGGSVAAEGAINLVDQSLAMHLTAVLSKEMSQQVGGTQIGGFMSTVLANDRGELVIPVIVSGTLNSPRFAPDVQKIAQMKLQKMVPTFGTPGNPASGILGGILGAIGGRQGQQQGQQPPPPEQGQAPAQADQPQPPPANPVGDLLQQILEQQKKKKKDQQPPPPPQ